MSLQPATARVPVRRALDEAMARNLGLITRREALRIGATVEEIRGLVRRGEWIVEYDGVYRSASAPRTALQRLKAAELAGGEGTQTSHRCACFAWELLASPPSRPEISVPRTRRPRL